MSFLSNYNLIYFLWFLRVFKPEWLISYFIPGTGLLRSVPTLLTYLVFVKFLISKEKKTLDISYLLFCIAIFLSTLFAFNAGRAEQGLRGALDSLIFYLISISTLKADEDLDRLFNLYLWGLVFYGLCGIAYNGRVPFHVILSDEDAFGPYMDIGIPLAFFAAFRYQRIKYLPVIAGLVCVTGLVASFARGAFVAFCSALLFIWYKFPHKFKITIILAASIALVLISSALFFPGNKFWNEMNRITKASAETESDRAFLWNKAYIMFKNYPITGVGPFNYGVLLPQVTTEAEAAARGHQLGHLYGRVPHNIYFQLLSELGLIGAFSFALLIIIFLKRNYRVQKNYRAHIIHTRKHRQQPDSILRRNYYYVMAVQGSMVAYLVSGLFYDLLFYHWLVDLLILNSLIYYSSLARSILIEGPRV